MTTTEIDEINLKIEAAIVQDKKDEDLFDLEPEPSDSDDDDFYVNPGELPPGTDTDGDEDES